jgi:hypothetical protein
MFDFRRPPNSWASIASPTNEYRGPMIALSFSMAAKIEFLTFPRFPLVETGSPGSDASGDFLIDSRMYFLMENAACRMLL